MSETGWVFLGMDSEKPKMRAESPGDVRPHNKSSREIVSWEDLRKLVGLKTTHSLQKHLGSPMASDITKMACWNLFFFSGGGVQRIVGVREEFMKPALIHALSKHVEYNKGCVHPYDSEGCSFHRS